jgi:hypothetical protein
MGDIDIDGDDQVFRNYWHIGALCTSKADRGHEEREPAVMAFPYKACVRTQHQLEKNKKLQAIYCTGGPKTIGKCTCP